MYKRRAACVLGLALAIAMPLQVATAADPLQGSTPADLPAIGFGHDPNAPMTPEGLGYTPAYASQKAAAAAARITPSGGVLDAAAMGSGSVSVALAPTSASLTAWWTNYHQKTNYNCLPAIGQSILQGNFGGYTAPSVAAKQGNASHAAGTIAKGMNTATNGTDDYVGLAYINGEFANHSSTWRYLPINYTDEGSFRARIVDEIYNLGEATYVRVDLTNTNYAWSQATPASQHATAGIAYSSSGTYTTVADPFTHLSGSTCVVHPYQTSNDVSCNWVNFSTHRYYLSKDKPRSNELPMFF